MAKRKKRDYQDDYYSYGYYPPSRPIEVSGGVQSKSKRGAFAANWWAKRWVAVLESYGIGSRLQRGRTYARKGQVLNIDIGAGRVKAAVQGSRQRPYKVEIEVNTLPDDEWERALDAISEQAIFAAQLLDGTMPQEIESAFASAGVSLFPQSKRDVVTDCSCPDYSNPCKHIAAVYYLLGEQFDEDPFLIFALRGREREQVMVELRSRRAAASGDADTATIALQSAPSLDEQIANFWGEASSDWPPSTMDAPTIDGAIVKRMGTPPAGTEKSLSAIYRVMSERGAL